MKAHAAQILRAEAIQAAPPHSLEAEKGVLSSMIHADDGAIAMAKARSQIDASYFYVPAHRTFFNVLYKMQDEGSPVDLITLTQILRDSGQFDEVGGAAYVTELATFVPTAANVQYYIDIVRDKYVLRELAAAATECVRRTHEEQCEPALVFDTFESKLTSLRSLQGTNGSRPLIQDVATLLEQPIVLPPDVIEQVLHLGGKLVFGGATKSFKTWLLIDLGISVATGAEWFHGYPTKKGRVLYINFELPAPFFAKRIRAICDERQISLKPEMLSVWNLRGYVTDWAQLQQQIPRGEFVLIIIDPIYKLLLGRDENRAGDIASLLNEIETLAVRTSAAVAFGAHYSKGNQSQKESIDRVSGSGVIARDPDTILNFTRHENEDCFTVEATLRNHPPIAPFVVRWEFPLFAVARELDPAALKKPRGAAVAQFSSDELLALLTGAMSTTQLQKLAYSERNVSRATFFRLLNELKKTEKIVQTPEKTWKKA